MNTLTNYTRAEDPGIPLHEEGDEEGRGHSRPHAVSGLCPGFPGLAAASEAGTQRRTQ